MLTWEFMTIDIDFLMFSEFFWYVLLFWGFCRYMSHDHCSGGISMGLRTIGLHWGLLCCWTQYGKTVPSGASTWKLLQKSWRANDGCWWSNQLNTSMVLICQGFLNFCFFFFGETEPFGNLVIFSKKKKLHFLGFLGCSGRVFGCWWDTNRTILSSETFVIGPLRLIQGGIGAIARRPLFTSGAPMFLPDEWFFKDETKNPASFLTWKCFPNCLELQVVFWCAWNPYRNFRNLDPSRFCQRTAWTTRGFVQIQRCGIAPMWFALFQVHCAVTAMDRCTSGALLRWFWPSKICCTPRNFNP